jgi:uncharacterized protein YcbK (DUF882 family)
LHFASLIAAIGFAGSFAFQPAYASDTRTISFHHVHTGEDLTITYKKNGQYDEAALKKINWIMRDWRKNQDIKMDPEAIDILWEVHHEVGATQPIHIICGYRSPETNNMLRRRSKGVARESLHTQGRAIDYFIPGVPLDKVRAAGMKLQGGGVGYYPTSGSPFVHMDVGNVRAWPRMTREQLVKLFPDGRTVHLPPDGQPLQGYQLALADLEKGHRSTPAPTKQRGIIASLFGIGQEAEESDDTAAVKQAPAAAAAARRPASTTTAVTAPVAAPVRTASAVPTPLPAPARPVAVAAVETAPVPLPPTRPIYQVASAESRPVPAPAPRTNNSATPSAFDIISARGLWDGSTSVAPDPLTDVSARRVSAPAAPAFPAQEAAPKDQIVTASTGPFARPDRVPADVALAYAALADTKAAAASAGTTGQAARPVSRSIEPATVTRQGTASVAIKPEPTTRNAQAKPADRLNDPWMRGLALVASVHDTMTTTRLGEPDYTFLVQFMRKPASAVMMMFSSDPHFGMTDTHFTGSAVVFQSTVTFGDQRTAALQ